MAEPSVVRTVSHKLHNANLDETRSAAPQPGGLLDEVTVLVQHIREASAKRPASATALPKAQVPPAQRERPRSR